MLLRIPVLDLLHSQLDIELDVGVDPFSGKLTYNIKDVHSHPRQPHPSHFDDLVLTLQSSPEDCNPGTLCIRIFPAQAAFSEHSLMNMSEVPPFDAFDTLGRLDQSEHGVHSKTTETLIPAAHAQGSFSNVDSMSVAYGPSAGEQGALDAITNLASLWASLQENVPQQSNVPDTMSPISQTLSLITSGSINEEQDLFGFNDLQFDPSCIQVDHKRYSTGGVGPHRSQDPINNVIDTQGQPGVEGNVSASCGSFSIIDLLTPVPHSESSSQTSSTVVPSTCDQIIVKSHPSTPFDHHGGSIRGEYTAPFPSSQGKSLAEPARDGKRNLYPCPFPSCGRVLKSMYTQRIHLKTHERKPHKHFPCTMGCPESFTRHHDRLRHEVAQHGKQCEFSCMKCTRFFSSQRMLDRHACWSWRNGGARWQRKDSPPSEI